MEKAVVQVETPCCVGITVPITFTHRIIVSAKALPEGGTEFSTEQVGQDRLKEILEGLGHKVKTSVLKKVCPIEGPLSEPAVTLLLQMRKGMTVDVDSTFYIERADAFLELESRGLVVLTPASGSYCPYYSVTDEGKNPKWVAM